LTYSAGRKIEATDYNGFVSTNSPNLNNIWSTGSGNSGYGQTAISTVSAGKRVQASEWSSLFNTISTIASHQGSTVTAVTAPATGRKIQAFVPTVSDNLTTINNNRLNASVVGSTSANTATFGSTWQNGLTFTHTAAFANANAARYFFNSGGQLNITCSHPAGININLLLNNLASNIGTVWMSSATSGSITIAGTSFNGITKVGGGGNSPTISTNSGYYSWTGANTTVFTQTASTGPAAYLGTFIRCNVLVSGSTVTVYTVWDEIPDGYLASTGSATTLTARFPSTTYLANTWGAVTLSGSVTGS
jgi:hypothetical protein